MGIFNIFKKKQGKHTDTDANNDSDANKHVNTGRIGGEDYASSMITQPREYADTTDSEMASYLEMGAFMIPYMKNIRIGINNKQSLVVYYKHSCMIIRAFAQEKHGYRWLHAINLMRTDKNTTIKTGAFGDEIEYKTKAGLVRMIGHDDVRWYVLAYINVNNEDVNKEVNDVYDKFFRLLVINRGREPMAPGDPLKAAMPDEDELTKIETTGIRFTNVGENTNNNNDNKNENNNNGLNNVFTQDETEEFKQELQRRLTTLRL